MKKIFEFLEKQEKMTDEYLFKKILDKYKKFSDIINSFKENNYSIKTIKEAIHEFINKFSFIDFLKGNLLLKHETIIRGFTISDLKENLLQYQKNIQMSGAGNLLIKSFLEENEITGEKVQDLIELISKFKNDLQGLEKEVESKINTKYKNIIYILTKHNLKDLKNTKDLKNSIEEEENIFFKKSKKNALELFKENTIESLNKLVNEVFKENIKKYLLENENLQDMFKKINDSDFFVKNFFYDVYFELIKDEINSIQDKDLNELIKNNNNENTLKDVLLAKKRIHNRRKI